MKRLSVVIPVYNEATRVNNTYARLDRFFSQRDYSVEYIFVEDGSSDGTAGILKELERSAPGKIRVIANETNMGKGLSIKRGVLEASGDYILFMDADMATPLQAFDDFEEHLDSYDIVMGSRWRKESNIKIPQPRFRRFMGFVFYAIVRTFFLKGIVDTNCGFKCYKKDAARDIFSKQLMKRWGFDVELLYIAQKRGYSIKEIPVVWAHGRDSKVNLFKVPAMTLVELASIKINDWKGRYEK
jgi:dolichyl-phosphate beta-glucosyltransferase